MKLRNIFMILASAALLTACDDVFTPAAENMKDINEMENDPIMAKGFVLTAYRNLPNYEVGTGTDVATDDAVTNEKEPTGLSMPQAHGPFRVGTLRAAGTTTCLPCSICISS